MRGIRFIVDEDGRRHSVILDLKVHGRLWKRISDQLDAEEHEVIPADEQVVEDEEAET